MAESNSETENPKVTTTNTTAQESPTTPQLTNAEAEVQKTIGTGVPAAGTTQPLSSEEKLRQKELRTEEIEQNLIDVLKEFLATAENPDARLKSHILLSQSLQNFLTNAESEDNQEKDKDTILELYKLEYTTGVKRHDDIYKSMWTNFSYMAILAGGILTFGKDKLALEFAGILTCLPLIFWFWSSFLPLDRYGNQVARRIAEIEKFINEHYFKSTSSYTVSDPVEYKKEMARKGLHLYLDFEDRKRKEEDLINRLGKKIRVRLPVSIFSILLHLVLIILIFIWGYNWFRFVDNNQNETTIKKLESINNTLGNMSNSINSLKNSYEINTQKSEVVNGSFNAQTPTNTNIANTKGANSSK